MTVTDVAVRERQIEIAWRDHRSDPRDRIPAEAWRAARAFKRSISGLTNITQALNDTTTVKRLVGDFTASEASGASERSRS